MKKMALFLMGVVLLLGFVSFAYADVDNASDVASPENDSLDNEVVVEINENLLDENQIENVDVVIEDEDLIIEKEVVQDKKNHFSSVISYVGSVINKINEVHENLFFIIMIILGVFLLFVYSIFFDCNSANVCFFRAFYLHRKGEIAHVKGNYAKAKKLYAKSYLLRERGEGIVSGRVDGSAI